MAENTALGTEFRAPVSLLKPSPAGTELALACGSTLQIFSLKDGSSLPLDGEKHTGIVRSINYNAAGDLCASTSDDKQVKIWSKQSSSWKLIASKKLSKKPTSAIFSVDGKFVVVADKFGDVLSFNIDGTNDTQIIMGHYASITDMVLSENGKFLITSDKDEHIRVSHFPEVYDIQIYCFGHAEYVSGLLFVDQQPDLLVSGSGDGRLVLWHWKTGKQLDLLQFEKKKADSEESITTLPLATHSGIVIAGIEGQPCLHVFQIHDNKLTKVLSVNLDHPPLCACFDAQGRLWVSSTPTVASTSFTKSLQVFVVDINSKSCTLLSPSDMFSGILDEVNNKCSLLVDKQSYDTTLHDLSKDVHFKKRGNDDMEGEPTGNQKKKGKIEHTNEPNPPAESILPKFV